MWRLTRFSGQRMTRMKGRSLARSSKPAARTGGSIGEKTAAKPLRSQTLQRGFEIIDTVQARPLTIPEIAEAVGLSYPTAHRLVSVLTEQRYLQTVEGRHFGLGTRLIELGFAAHAATDLVQITRERLQRLAELTRDTVHLAQRDGREAFYLDKLRGSRLLEIASRIGGRKPLLTTGVGKALLLDDSPEALRALLAQDAHLLTPGTTPESWLASMDSYRAGGFAFDLGEEEPIVRCVAAPIRDASGRIIAAVSISSTREYTDDARMHALVPVIKDVAAEVSARLGYRNGPREGGHRSFT